MLPPSLLGAQVHWQSEAFKAFQRGCQEAGLQWVEKDVSKYHEQDVGFA
jgi:hypothetical protein